MSAINYVKKFVWLVGVVTSACLVTPVEGLPSAFSPLSSSNPAVTASFTKTQPTPSIPHPIFRNILAELKTRTSLPIRLPAYIPEVDSANPVYALLETASHSEYRILLAFSKNCTGGNACRLGSIFAQAISPKTPALTGKAVSLAHGMTGYFTDAICGANCSDATLVWEQDKVRYTVAIKASKIATLVKMADSALVLGPIPRQMAQSPMDRPTTSKRKSPFMSESMTISAAGIDRAKLGMTFGQLKQMLGSSAQLRVESPFRVDFDALAVSQSGQVQYYIFYPTGTTLADTDKIQILLTDNPKFHTAQGVGPGTLLRQAEAIYGDATLSYNTSNESREYIKFANQPQGNIHFRPVAVGQKFAGIYPSPEREYNDTRRFQSTA